MSYVKEIGDRTGLRFFAQIGVQIGPARKTALGAVKTIIKTVQPEGPVRVEIYEDGSLLATVHGSDGPDAVKETAALFARNRRRF